MLSCCLQHNHGTYTLEDASPALSLAVRRRTGDDRYTDRMDFGFSPTASGGCTVEACSESQGNSWGDRSTNYCNVKVLLCGSSERCPWVLTDLDLDEQLGNFMAGASHDFSQCIAQ